MPKPPNSLERFFEKSIGTAGAAVALVIWNAACGAGIVALAWFVWILAGRPEHLVSVDVMVPIVIIAALVIGISLYIKYDAQFVFGKEFIKQHGWPTTLLLWIIVGVFFSALYYLWDKISR